MKEPGHGLRCWALVSRCDPWALLANQADSLQREAKSTLKSMLPRLNKTQDFSISHAGTGGNVHIIDMALVSSQPAQAKTTLLIAAGGLLEVIACEVYAFVRRAFFAGADDPDLVERRFNLPIFGAIAFSGEQASWIVRWHCPQRRERRMASSG